MRPLSLAAAYLFMVHCGGVLARDVNVGPDRALQTLSAGVAAAASGDTVILDPGIYTDQTATISVPLTILGAGAGAVLRITQPIANHKGILIVNAALRISNVTFQGARVTSSDGNNGAGIRLQSGNLRVEHCIFDHDQDGILTNADSRADVIVDSSVFSANGAGDGYSHAIYIGAVRSLTVAKSTFDGTLVGHDIKSRAAKTFIRDSTLDDGVTGTASYAVDTPNGGVVVLQNLVIRQGANTSNLTMVAYGAEGNLHINNSLKISHTRFINTRPGNSIAVNNFTHSVNAELTGNVFTGVATILRGMGTVVP